MLGEVQLGGARVSEKWGAGTEVLIRTFGLPDYSQRAGDEEDKKREGHHEGWCLQGTPSRAALGSAR